MTNQALNDINSYEDPKTMDSVDVAKLESLQYELLKLTEKYGDYIDQESLRGEVECLKNWIDSAKKGSSDTLRYLNEYGEKLIRHIREKLDKACDQLQRMDAESPGSSQNFTGGKSDRLNKAAMVASKAEDKLTKCINSNCSSELETIH